MNIWMVPVPPGPGQPPSITPEGPELQSRAVSRYWEWQGDARERRFQAQPGRVVSPPAAVPVSVTCPELRPPFAHSTGQGSARDRAPTGRVPGLPRPYPVREPRAASGRLAEPRVVRCRSRGPVAARSRPVPRPQPAGPRVPPPLPAATFPVKPPQRSRLPDRPGLRAGGAPDALNPSRPGRPRAARPTGDCGPGTRGGCARPARPGGSGDLRGTLPAESGAAMAPLPRNRGPVVLGVSEAPVPRQPDPRHREPVRETRPLLRGAFRPQPRRGPAVPGRALLAPRDPKQRVSLLRVQLNRVWTPPQGRGTNPRAKELEKRWEKSPSVLYPSAGWGWALWGWGGRGVPGRAQVLGQLWGHSGRVLVAMTAQG
ncbi:uncharacterized protein LOC114060347 [Empidonax traillii]|uniref:uncharacterized protein LOC114060347 n=1 Tax=Empidonax traillii TaxID=164674 RepID=UPI000FFCF03C|nr:uncharacterized protein LOC114060347 [Empidonax traillii]